MVLTVDEVTNAISHLLVPVPATGPGICSVCHRGDIGSYPHCYSCHRVMQSVSQPCLRVVPITLMAKSTQMYAYARNYKTTGTAGSATRTIVAAIIGRFLRDHDTCLGTWDLITHVPSKTPSPSMHPLGRAIERVQGRLRERHRDILQPGSGTIRRREGDDAGFTVTSDIRDARVLLVDDTWVTGATAQSAASALTLAGADVIALVVVGRLIDPHPAYQADIVWWKAQSALAFDFDTCCLE